MNIEIAGTCVGIRNNVYIIAELSANHNHDFDQAIQLIKAAKEAGADAIKLQTYTPDTITIDCDNEYFRIGKGTIWEGKNLYELYKEAYTPWEWQPKLKIIANDLGLDLFSSPFDPTAVDFLEEMGVPAYKVASCELVDIPLIQHIAKTGKPIIMSTGMATLTEIDEAVTAAREAGCQEIALLECTTAYPAEPAEMNLRTIPHIAEAFGVPVGLSDHTLGIAVPVAAVALGACIVEKHFTLSRSTPGPDTAFSLEPHEFKAMVDAVRTTEKALGKVNYSVTDKEVVSRVFRRSLFVVKDMKAGDVFTRENIRSIRPGYGLHTRFQDKLIGCRANENIPAGTPLGWRLIVQALGGDAVPAVASRMERPLFEEVPVDYYQNNIKILREYQPQLVDLIEATDEDGKTARVLIVEGGESRVIWRGEGGEESYIDTSADPAHCARQAIDLMDRSEKEGIFVLLGFGMGYLAEELLKHFETGHAMLIYEATPLLFKTALRARDLTRVFASDRVKVVVGEDGDDFSIIHNYHQHIVNGKFWVVAHKPSKRLNEGAYERFRTRLEDEKRITLAGVATAIGLGKDFVNTFLQNVPSLLHKPGVTSLRNVFEGRPAIVVAAGPSLDRNLHLLKKAKSRALIIAVDASLPTLISAGIIPDVCVAIDPLSSNVGLFRDNPRLKEVPFVCLAQYTPDIVKMYPGPLFMDMVEGNIVYQWLRGYWEEKGCIACFGGSVSHLAFAVAEFMGASTICLMGLDLSFEEKFHAGDATRLIHSEVHQEVPDYRIGAETAQDIFGEKRYTLQSFLTFRTSFENRIKSFSGLVFNATEGGLPVAGTENIRLADFIEEFCNLPGIDMLKILSGLAETEVRYNIEGLAHEIKEAREAFSRIRKHSLDILKCIRKIKVLRKEERAGDEFDRTLDRIERLTEKVRSPILNIIASYHYQLELYLKKQEMQDMDDIEDRWERLDAQLERGINYYGELVEAIQLFMKQLDALGTGLERERKIRAVLGDTRLSESVRLVRAGREYRRLGLATQAALCLEQGVKRARSGSALPDQEAAKSAPAMGEVLDAQLDLADTYITQFRFYEARAVLDQTTRVTDSRARDKRTEKLLALCTEKIGAWEERERQAAAGLAKAKTEYGDYLSSGEFYFRTKNFVRAERAYTRAIAESRLLAHAHQTDGTSRLVAAYYGLAHTHLKLNENQKAVEAFADALQADPANPLIYRDLALMAMENGNHDSGEMFLKKALELAPWSDELYSLLARLYLGLGETQKAIALYERGVQLNPQNANFQKELVLRYRDVINQGQDKAG